MKYDFKDSELLQISDFCCEECLLDDILQGILQLRSCETLEVYAKAELIEELIARLHGYYIDEHKITFGMIDFDGQGFDYAGVYCLAINDDYTLWVEPAYRFDRETNTCELFNSEATLAYVYQEDCEQELLDKLEENEVHTLLFGFDVE